MLWFMMDSNNKPLFMEDNNTGKLYQVLDVVNDQSERMSTLAFDKTINSDEIDDGSED